MVTTASRFPGNQRTRAANSAQNVQTWLDRSQSSAQTRRTLDQLLQKVKKSSKSPLDGVRFQSLGETR